ncbi:MAG: polysaccharide biosynthesis/export family protein [Candidatus Scalinduaceae bacterium]
MLRELVSNLLRRNASSVSRGMIKLDSARFFSRVLMFRTPVPARQMAGGRTGIHLGGKFQRGLLTCLLFFALVGCSEYRKSSSAVDYQNITNVKFRERYLIDSYDILGIKIYDEPGLSMSIRVSDEGILAYPLIGGINVKGLTTQEVEKVMEERLRDGYIKNPKVTIMLDIQLMERHKEKEVFVVGEVTTSGAIPILGKYLSVLEAVAKAGGFTEFAAPNRIKVIRVEEGEEKTIMVNLNKVRKGDKSLDIILKPGDVVVVPETYM